MKPVLGLVAVFFTASAPLAFPSFADVAGPTRVIDGDTLDVVHLVAAGGVPHEN